ncbi:hypothetical protein CIB48_g11242 [Xylaria polymorpha]|nr:hypothetical protein CIB48_g11242 [Xylaria polymorpha]
MLTNSMSYNLDRAMMFITRRMVYMTGLRLLKVLTKILVTAKPAVIWKALKLVTVFGRRILFLHPLYFSSSSLLPPPPPPPGFGFGRGFGRGRDRGGDRGWEQPHDAAEQANRMVAEAISTAEKEKEKSLAAAAQVRDKALAQAERERAKATEVAEESRRAAAEAVRRSRAAADRARDNAMSVANEAVSRATVESKLAEARALESQISAKAKQVQTLEENLGRDHDAGEKSAGNDKLRAIEQLEVEMELLGRKVETLRVEADEEFARRLAQTEDEWGEWK